MTVAMSNPPTISFRIDLVAPHEFCYCAVSNTTMVYTHTLSLSVSAGQSDGEQGQHLPFSGITIEH